MVVLQLSFHYMESVILIILMVYLHWVKTTTLIGTLLQKLKQPGNVCTKTLYLGQITKRKHVSQWHTILAESCHAARRMIV